MISGQHLSTSSTGVTPTTSASEAAAAAQAHVAGGGGADDVAPGVKGSTPATFERLPALGRLLHACWQLEPEQRPTAAEARRALLELQRRVGAGDPHE